MSDTCALGETASQARTSLLSGVAMALVLISLIAACRPPEELDEELTPEEVAAAVLDLLRTDGTGREVLLG